MSGEMLGAAPQAMGGWNSSLQGKVLKGHYRIEKKIAQGGMSWLYLVTHVLLEEQMALKLLYPHLLEDPLARQRFIAEAQIQFRLQHPNIVHVTEIIAEPNLLGIVQEWISGPSLKTYLRGCRELLSLGKIWSCAKAVLDALQYAHEQGVVHRDIKPSNILLQEKWGIPGLTPKLSDFGVAKMMGAEHGRTATGTMIGTFNYIAPEQIRNGKTADERSDIYGMGVMLYQLTTGRLPFLGSFERLMFQHLTEEPEDPCKLNPALPPEVGKIVLRCMSKKPEERYRSCRALSEALEQCCPEPEILFPHPRRQKQFMRSPSQQFPRTPSQIGRGQEHGSASFERAYDSSQSSYLFDSSQSFAGGAPRASGPDDSNAILQKDPFSEMFKDQQFHRDDTRERIKQANAEGVAEELELPSKSSIEDMPQSLELSPREEGKEEEGLWSGGHLSHRISKSLKIPKFQKNDSLELDLLAGEGENGGDKHDEDKNVPEEPIFSEPQVVVRPESLPVVLSDESSALWDDQAGGSSASSRFIPIVLIVLLALAGGVWFFVGGQKPDPQNKPSKQRGIAVARTLEPRTSPTGSEPRVPADRGAEPGSNKPVLVPGGACKNGKTRSCFGGA